jgi:mannonate dehydratase
VSRRAFLRTLALAPLAAAGGCKLSLEQGLFNACRTGLDASLQPVLDEAWRGLRPERVWDAHAHLFGNGLSGQGIWLSPEYDRPVSGAGLRRMFFLDGACGGKDDHTTDEAIVGRIGQIAEALPGGAKLVLLAFDCAYDEEGKRRKDLTAFWVPDEYVARVARARPDRFEWTASIHPYRTDAVVALEAAKRAGARAVKWLPPAMGIDPASPRCRAFYDALERLDVPLLVHVGAEQAVQGAGRHAHANPLLLRHPLEAGVRVIAAHCATMGESPDLDRDRNPDMAPQARNVDLFARLMGERRYEGRLFGDLSAVTQANRAENLPLLIEKQEWHPRLLNGSDYPLPGILPLFSLQGLVGAGLLEERLLPALQSLRESNPLLFDFVLKRSLRYRGSRFADAAFETRDFFLAPSPSPGAGQRHG